MFEALQLRAESPVFRKTICWYEEMKLQYDSHGDWSVFINDEVKCGGSLLVNRTRQLTSINEKEKNFCRSKGTLTWFMAEGASG